MTIVHVTINVSSPKGDRWTPYVVFHFIYSSQPSLKNSITFFYKGGRFRTKKKMERLSQMSLANVKEARRKRDRDRKIGDVLWVIVRFSVFLLLIITITNAHQNTTPAFHQTQSAANSFVSHTDAVSRPRYSYERSCEVVEGDVMVRKKD